MAPLISAANSRTHPSKVSSTLSSLTVLQRPIQLPLSAYLSGLFVVVLDRGSSITDTQILLVARSMARKKGTSQLSGHSATTTTLLLLMKYSIIHSTSSLWGTELVVALRDQATTGAPFMSTNHRLRSARSKSGIGKIINSYGVSNSTARTVQLFWRLDGTGLLLVIAKPSRCIFRMESES